MPLMMSGRAPEQRLAATWSDLGTDVDFGALTRSQRQDQPYEAFRRSRERLLRVRSTPSTCLCTLAGPASPYAMQFCSTQAFYAIGELACFTLPDGTMLPGLAPVALQQGKHVARNIEAALAGKSKEPFHSVDKGIMATVGRASGIAQAGALKLSGMLGWLAWLFIHILFLIGFRNRLLVMFQWAWAWFTYGRGSRLITGTTPVPESRSAKHPLPVATAEAPKVHG
jgi:hypothetical protein